VEEDLVFLCNEGYNDFDVICFVFCEVVECWWRRSALWFEVEMVGLDFYDFVDVCCVCVEMDVFVVFWFEF